MTMMCLFFVCIALIMVFYFKLKGRKKTNDNEIINPVLEIQPAIVPEKPNDKIEIYPGQTTGQIRVFNTNKGLRSYYVDEKGLPILVHEA